MSLRAAARVCADYTPKAEARLHRIEMPIAEAIARVLDEGLPVREAVEGLLKREPRPERDE